MRNLTSAFFTLALFLSACSSVSLDPTKYASRAADANRDESRIEKALHILCEKGQSEFCEKEARILLENGKTDAAKLAAAKGCTDERSSPCALQGEILLGEGKVSEAAKVLTPACESKIALDGIACPGAGEAAFLSNDPAKAQRLWKRGCRLGSLASCHFEGKALRLANRIPESALPLRKACDGGVVGACSELGISLALDSKMDSAVEKFAADCDRRSQRACRWLPLLEEKVKNKSLEKTLDEDCRKNNSFEACYDSIVLQFLRKGGRTLALYRWKENCKAGHKMSCWESFTEENSLRPISQMDTELERFCNDSILMACYFRGLNYAERGRKDLALPIWTSACEKGEAWSCALVAEVDSLADIEKAKFREKACTLGLKRACTDVDPAVLEMKVSRSTDPTIDYNSACTGGDADACAYLALKKIDGTDAGYRDGEVKEQFRKACLASSTLGCEGLVKGLE